MNGKEASFWPGVNFPIPRPTGQGITAVTIQFKEFGVKLEIQARHHAER